MLSPIKFTFNWSFGKLQDLRKKHWQDNSLFGSIYSPHWHRQRRRLHNQPDKPVVILFRGTLYRRSLYSLAAFDVQIAQVRFKEFLIFYDEHISCHWWESIRPRQSWFFLSRRYFFLWVSLCCCCCWWWWLFCMLCWAANPVVDLFGRVIFSNQSQQLV